MILRIKLVVLVIVHIFLCIMNLGSFFVLPFYEKWYIAAPLMSVIFVMSTAKWWRCPLTELENELREKLGMKKIGGFLGFYFWKLPRIWLGIKRDYNS